MPSENSAKGHSRRRGYRRFRRHRRWFRKKRFILPLSLLGIVLTVAAVVLLTIGFVGEKVYSYEDALTKFKDGNYKSAIIVLKNVLGQDRGNLSARLLIGRAYLAIGYASAAEQELRRAKQAGADEKVVSIPMANAFLQLGKYDTLFEELVPDNQAAKLKADLFRIHGEAHLQLRQLDRAEENFRNALELRDQLTSALLGLARVRLYQGEFEQAQQFIQQVLDREAEHVEAWYVQAELSRAQRDIDNALLAYEKALLGDPKHLTARLARAAVLIDRDEHDRAKDDLLVVWSMRPNDPQAYYLYALILTHQNELDKARKMLERAKLGLSQSSTSFTRNHPPSLLLLAVVHYRINHFDEARNLISRFVELEPYHAGGRKLKASLQLQQGDAGPAVNTLLPLVTADTRDHELLVLLGKAYLRSNQSDKAYQVFRKATELRPEQSDIHTQIALTRLTQGRRQDAESELVKAMSLSKDSQQAGLMLGMLQLENGEHDAALQTAEKLIRQYPAVPEVYNMKGVVMLARKDLKSARRSFHDAYAQDPSYVTALVNLARLDSKEGQVQEAVKRYHQIMEIDGNNTTAMIALSEYAVSQGDKSAAIAWLEKVRAIDNSQLSPQLTLIELYYQVGQNIRAEQLIMQVQKKFPDNVAVRVARGRSELAAGRLAAAKKTFDELAQEGSSSEQLFQLSKYQIAAGDITRAKKTLLKVLQQEPYFLPAQAAMVDMALREGDLGQALQRARNILQAHPGVSSGYLYAGEVLSRMKHYDKARRVYEEGLSRFDAGEFVVRLFRLHEKTGQAEDAQQQLEKWSQAHPENHEVARILASSYVKQRQYDKAMTLFESLLKTRPNDAVVINNLAGLYLASGDTRARELAERAYQIAPQEAAVLDTLGWVMANQGEAEQGLKFLREAHDRRAEEPTIIYHIGYALAQLGRTEDARNELSRALSYGTEFIEREQAEQLLKQLTP